MQRCDLQHQVMDGPPSSVRGPSGSINEAFWTFCSAKRRNAERSCDVFSRKRLRWLVLLDPEHTEWKPGSPWALEDVQSWRRWCLSGRGGGEPSSDWLFQETPLQLTQLAKRGFGNHLQGGHAAGLRGAWGSGVRARGSNPLVPHVSKQRLKIKFCRDFTCAFESLILKSCQFNWTHICQITQDFRNYSWLVLRNENDLSPSKNSSHFLIELKKLNWNLKWMTFFYASNKWHVSLELAEYLCKPCFLLALVQRHSVSLLFYWSMKLTDG